MLKVLVHYILAHSSKVTVSRLDMHELKIMLCYKAYKNLFLLNFWLPGILAYCIATHRPDILIYIICGIIWLANSLFALAFHHLFDGWIYFTTVYSAMKPHLTRESLEALEKKEKELLK